jgi:predicted DNA-binding transcriptional regulator YafY
MKFEIMLSILFELLSKRCVKASYLAEKFEVSVRSIYRYVSALEMAGVPLYTIRGNRGGIAIIDTYKLSSTFMTVKEFETVINTLTAITESVPNDLLEKAINKLKSTVKNEYSGFDIKSGNLIIDAGPWGDTTSYKSKLVIIQQSIQDCKKLSITYHDRNGEITNRVIEPHLILFKQGLWYVFAFCQLRNEFRFFKTGRIEHANILNDKFTRRDLSNMDLPLDFWHNSVQTTDVVLEIEKSVLSDVEEWLGIENVQNRNGKFFAYVKLPFDNGLVNKIMSYGSGIKVIEPLELKEQIIKQTKQILKIYN